MLDYTNASNLAEPARWVPNDRIKSCTICKKKFNVFRRKHHCRQCGSLVCGACSPDKDYVSGFQDTKKRMCRYCLGNKSKRVQERSTTRTFMSGSNLD